MRILGDLRRRVTGVINQDFLRGDGDVDGLAEAFHVKRAIGPQEFHQI